MLKRVLSVLLPVVGVPLVLAAGYLLFGAQKYAWICLCAAALSCVPFFLSFEKGRANAQRLALLAVMTALSVAGRVLFAALPGFKPVTALVVLTAMYFGPQAGFMTGALSALLSNFYFGQGPWTPLQMFAWGMVGFLAGLLAKPLQKSRAALLLYGAFSGALFSLVMDVWTVLWWDGGFRLSRYAAAAVSSAGFMAVYAVSNVVFLLVLARPVGRVFERLRQKYGL